jgi:hypothetical protein
MSQPPAEPRVQSPQTIGPAGANGEPDPLAALPKMERTAGLTEGDYVAINATAVVALLLGLLSGAAVLGVFLLAIPIVTVFVALLAIRQIRRSGGTQKGQALAATGLILALIFVVWRGGLALAYAHRVASESNQIIALVDQFGSRINHEQYDQAYQLCTSRFRDRVRLPDFIRAWQDLQALAWYGRIKQMHWNGYLEVQFDPDTGQPTALGKVIIELESGGRDDQRGPSTFRKVGDTWFFDDMPIEFRPANPALSNQPQVQ